ncbi:MAG TPA: peptidase S9, partial [Rhodothermales bacterium]
MRRSAAVVRLLTIMLLAGVLAEPSQAQYFGRNKVQYDRFDFKIIETEHFQIYYYPEEEQAVQDAARMAERWYARHSQTFLREFAEKKPVIFYANDADFHQTNIIGGFIGEGTGGVTEGLKQRVVMPLTGSYADTDHVLGHELVHSFQYDIAFSSQDSLRFALGMLPLWLIEGTAEYLSVGRQDPHTAMWLRDAALRDDLPTTDQLTRDPRYFPYRYGQAYMAYIGGKYNDAAVAKIYKLAGRVGLDSAFVYTLGITADSLSEEWKQVVKDTYLPQLEGRTPANEAGRMVLSEEMDAGEVNIAPSISPDGNYVAFMSERDDFSINLFLADARTGEVLDRLIDINSDPHFDALRFINSSGSWSPDGTHFVFVTFADGDNQLAILDVNRTDVERRISVQGVGAITNPAWAPDGRHIAFSGMDGGISDLYVVNIETGEVRQLTNDRFADLQPAWSPDGQRLAFTTDRGDDGSNFLTLEYAPMRLGLIDVASGAVEVMAPFPHALHHNPQFSPDGRDLYFISDQDGFKDIYRLTLSDGSTRRITNLQTGVSGITALSPAMSVAAQSGRMTFSVFSDNKYSVFSLEPSELEGTPASPQEDAIATAGLLPPVRAVNTGLVSNYLQDPLAGLPEPQTYSPRDYSAKLKLDYVAPPTIGASVGGPFGTQVGGGVGFFFSDMLGNHNLTLVAAAQGSFKDIGGQISYLNRANRLNWGAGVGHIPFLTGGAWVESTGNGTGIYNQLRRRIFIDEASLVGAYPLSTIRRFEINASFVRYGFDYEVERFYI